MNVIGDVDLRYKEWLGPQRLNLKAELLKSFQSVHLSTAPSKKPRTLQVCTRIGRWFHFLHIIRDSITSPN